MKKQRWQESEKRGKEEIDKITEEKTSDEKRGMCAKGRKVAEQCVFQRFVALEGRKEGSLKRRLLLLRRR